MKDCCNQEIVPILGRKLEIHTNRHPSTDGTLWGWIEGCTLNICWADNKNFNREKAGKFITEYNQTTEADRLRPCEINALPCDECPNNPCAVIKQ